MTRYKQRYYERIEKGLCPRCGKNPIINSKKLCIECQEKYSNWLKNRSPELRQKHSRANKKWMNNNPDKVREKQSRYRKKLKKEVISHYGEACVCCGEKNIAFLTIDHINGGGNIHRKSIFGAHTSGNHFYLWLKKNSFPDGFQTMCWNCNMAKAHFGVCPHVHGE